MRLRDNCILMTSVPGGVTKIIHLFDNMVTPNEYVFKSEENTNCKSNQKL